MLFDRRRRPHLRERLRIALWPRHSWSRSLRYYGRRVTRLSGSPHAIAAGFAAGVFVSWTPFLGFHIAIAAVIALLLSGSFVAAVFGTLAGNPLTFPFMWWSSYALGSEMLHGNSGTLALADVAKAPIAEIVPVLKPMLLGAVPLGIISGIAAYLIVRFAVNSYQIARRHRLSARRTAANA